MKNLKLMALLLILFTIGLAGAGATLEFSDVKLGGTNQDRGENTSASITITNKGPLTIEDLELSFPGTNTKHQLSGSFSALTIAPNASITMTVKGFVPFDLDAVDASGRKISEDIGDINVKGTYTNNTEVSKTANLLMEAKSNLIFGSDSELLINDKTKKSLRDEKEFDIERDDDIKVSVQLRNLFDDKGDCDDDGTNCDFTDIEGNIESDDSDIDMDESFDTDSIDADDEETESFSFDIPDDLDEGDYDIEMYIVDEDEHGARHGDRWTFTLTLEVPRDEITIKSFDLSPESLSCNDRKTTLSITLKNTGSDDQEDVSIFIDSTKLDIRDSIYNIELDEGDTVTKTFDLTVPDKLAAGNYYIQIVANVESDEETDRESATLVVSPCVSTQPPVVTPPKNNATTPGDSNTEVKVIEVPSTSGVIYGKEKQAGFLDSPSFVLVLAGVLFIALLLLIILVVILLKK